MRQPCETWRTVWFKSQYSLSIYPAGPKLGVLLRTNSSCSDLHHTCTRVALWALILTPPSAFADDGNIVRESTEIMDVSPSITTNVIGQKTDEVGSNMCERSCEELSTMFQELNGLRVVVSNLIDGLQKVVSGSVFFCPVFVLLQIDGCCYPKKTNILEKIDILRK